MSKVKILEQGCDPTAAEDKSLPYTAYLVEYLQNGLTTFDLVISAKEADIFDHYWDLYKHDLIRFTQSSGTINPKLWGNTTPSTSKKKK